MAFVLPSQLVEQMALVEQHIRRATRSREQVLSDAASRLAESGGKRLRPLFVLIGGAFGTAANSALPEVAAAMELLHMATLVHDDIIDESPVRRGQPTVQASYGKDVAVFTGDFLLTKALWLLARAKFDERHVDLAQAMVSICEEEVGQWSGRHQAPSIRRYLRRIRGKTASLFVLSLVAGARQCEAPASVIRHLYRYGLDFGMAFQIEDDILDFSAQQSDIGKPVGHDIRSGVYTLPLIYALSDPGAGPVLKELLRDPQSVDPDEVVKLVRQTGALGRVTEMRDAYLKKACDIIRDLPQIEARQWLLDIQSQVFTSVTRRLPCGPLFLASEFFLA